MDGMLSQDEINALLSGMGTEEASIDAESSSSVSEGAEVNTSDDSEFILSDSEKDAVGEISNISMGTAATTLSSLLNQKVNITTPKVSISTWDELATKYDRPCVLMHICYREGIDGNNVLILKENDVRIITDLMMGGSGEVQDDESLTELHLSAIGEAMNQMMGSAATSLSSMFNRKIDISPPTADLVDTYTDSIEGMPKFLADKFVIVAFTMQIGDLIDSEIMQLYPIEFARELLELFMPGYQGGSSAAQSSAAQSSAAQSSTTQNSSVQNSSVQNSSVQNSSVQGNPVQSNPMQQDMGMMSQQMAGYGMPMQQGMGMMPQQMMGYGMPMQQGMGMMPQQMAGYGMPQQDYNVAPAAFQPFSNDLSGLSQKENIDLIMDVPLEVTVELGRTTKSIKDILEFSPGTIVELNKIAGEAIDVLVNGKYVAKGEVVVIEESFGVRITEIVK